MEQEIEIISGKQASQGRMYFILFFKKYRGTFVYAQKAVENGWSRNVLELSLESDLYHREGKAITNFKKTLAGPQSDMAHQLLKDPYFNFLT